MPDFHALCHRFIRLSRPLAYLLPRKALQRKVHPALFRAELVAGDEHARVSVDYSAENVRRRVHSHERIAALPVYITMNFVAAGQFPVQFVDYLSAFLSHGEDGKRFIAFAYRAGIARLPATAGIECRVVQRDEFAVRFHDGGVEFLEIEVLKIERVHYSVLERTLLLVLGHADYKGISALGTYALPLPVSISLYIRLPVSTAASPNRLRNTGESDGKRLCSAISTYPKATNFSRQLYMKSVQSGEEMPAATVTMKTGV